MLLRHVTQLEDSRIGHLHDEQRLLAARGLGVELELHLELVARIGAHVDVDVNVQLRRLLVGAQRAWGARILERQILGVLTEDVESGLLLVLLSAWLCVSRIAAPGIASGIAAAVAA